MPLLSVSSLKVSIPSDDATLNAVDGLSFHIERGEVFGLVGESGCGKSLTALAIMRLLPEAALAPEGSILFEGVDLLGKSEREMRMVRGNGISMVFQEPMTSLNPVFTIGFQIAEILTTHTDISKKESLNRAVELLRQVKVPSPEKRIKQYPHQMSGGMRQRVMIAMALACKPALIIADEPTTALDVTIQAQILDLLEDLRKTIHTSLLFITHDLGVVSEVSQRVMVMYAGAAMEQAASGTIFKHPLHPYTRGLMESLPGGEGTRLKPIPGVVPSPQDFPPGCRFAPRCGYRVDECESSEPEFRELESGHFVRCIRAEEFIT